MSLDLPERIADLTELDDVDARACYRQEGGVYVLHPPLLALYEQFLADVAAFEAKAAREMAELQTTTARMEAELARRIITGAARDALLDAGAEPGLIDGITAHFCQEVELAVGPDETVATADGLAGIAFAAHSWLDAQTWKYRGRRVQEDAGDGQFATALRRLRM